MTPSLRELLERHPAPWVVKDGDGGDSTVILDANDEWIVEINDDDQNCEWQATNEKWLPEILVSLVNAAAAEVGR